VIVAWAWEQLSNRQREQAKAQCGFPPSGPEGVLWVCEKGRGPVQWRWRSALWPDDVRKGVRLGAQR